MTIRQLEKVVTKHLIESTGITTKLASVDNKINWVLGLISAAFIVLLGAAVYRR